MVNAWMNDDDLYIKFGLSEGVSTNGGQILDSGPYRCVELDLDYTDFASSATIVNDVVTIPDGARIDRVQIVTVTAFDSAGDAFVFNVGLVKADDRTTAIDADGLVAALPQASVDAAGETQEIIIGHTYVGLLIGTTLTDTGLICVDYDTAAPTAGAMKLRIFYYMTE